jgi:hypothetical protein
VAELYIIWFLLLSPAQLIIDLLFVLFQPQVISVLQKSSPFLPQGPCTCCSFNLNFFYLALLIVGSFLLLKSHLKMFIKGAAQASPSQLHSPLYLAWPSQSDKDGHVNTDFSKCDQIFLSSMYLFFFNTHCMNIPQYV